MDGKNHSLRRKLADKDAVRQVFTSFILTLISSFFANYERTLPTDFQFAQMDLARIRVLRTLINFNRQKSSQIANLPALLLFLQKTRHSVY